MTILPVAAFVLMLLILKKKDIGGRRGFLAATTFWGTSVVLITELLSVPRLVTRGGVAIAWLAICVVCLIVYSKLELGAIALPSEQRSSSDVTPIQRTTPWIGPPRFCSALPL